MLRLLPSRKWRQNT